MKLKNMLTQSIIFLLCFVALSLWGFYWAIWPLKIISPITPENFKLPYENVAIQTSDNIIIRGWFIPNANPNAKAIILLHGYPADKGNILPSRYFLHQKYSLLFIDFRYLGESGGKYSTVGKNEVLDVLAAIHYLRSRNIHEVGIWGFSLGGAVALMSAINVPEIKAIVAEAPYAQLDKMADDYFRIPLLKYPLGGLLRFWAWLFLGYDLKNVSPVKSASQLKIPILIMHSKHDHVVSFEHAELFRQQLKNKSNVQFLFFEDLPHGQASQYYEKIITNFFDKNLQ